MMEKSRLEAGDYAVICLYFAAILATGLYSMYRTNRSTVSGYFLAGRFMIWLPIGASLFASNIGSEHFIGLAGSGAAAGIAVGAFELNACIILQLLGWVFLPVYIASGVCTLPEYMSARFGGKRIRIYLAMLSLVLYIFTRISVNLYSGALFIEQAVHLNLYVAVLVLLLITALTTVAGGLAAVIYMETLQACLVVVGATVLTVLSFIKVGGYEGLYQNYTSAIPNTSLNNPNTTCGYPRPDSWYMLRNPVGSDMPWPGFIFGQSLVSVWYWCADQLIVQRALAAKDLSHAQGATLFAGFLKLLPPFLIVLPGMISRVLFTERVACADADTCERVCQSRISCSNIAYPTLVLELLPTGLRGLLMSVMLAAQMSEMSSIFNSASTLFTMDIYKYIRRQAANKELMIVGRMFASLMVVVSIFWIPVVQVMQGGQLFLYIQAVSAYLAPPVATVYLLAILWPGANEKGAFWGLVFGTVVGIVRMVCDFAYPDPQCDVPDTRPAIIARIHYMYFAIILALITLVTAVIGSILTHGSDRQHTVGLTYWTRYQQRSVPHPVHELADKRDGGTDDTLTMATSPVAGDDTMGSLPHLADTHLGQNETTELVDAGKHGDSHRHRWSSALRRLARWYCGLESPEGDSSMKESERRTHRLHSLEQTQAQRWCLRIFLIIVLCLVLFLYVFFSAGSHF